MDAITRGRTIAAAGFLTASALLGVALAVGPAVQHQSHAVMQQESRPVMQQESRPAMQQEGTLAMQQESRPVMQQEGTPAAVN